MHFYTFLFDAITDNIDPAIIGYMFAYRDELDICNIDFWKEINKIYKKNFTDYFNIPLMRFTADKYRVNHSSVTKFLDYIKHDNILDNLPNPENLLTSSEYVLYSKKNSVSHYHHSFQYIFNIMMCYTLLKYHTQGSAKYHNAAANYIKYIIKRFNADTGTSSIKHAVQVWGIPLMSHELWYEIVDNYGNIIPEPRRR